MSRTVSVIRVCLVMLGLVAFSGITSQPCQAQFLDKLEQAIRNQVNKSQVESANNSTGELPPPTPNRSSSGLETPRVVGPLPSILETPMNSPEVSTLPSVSAKAGFLGLEAEEIVGGGLGVRVSGVTERSPAWKAGITEGDRIMAVNGYALANLDDMVEQLGKVFAGDAVRFLVARGSRNIELTAVLMDAELAGQIMTKDVLNARPQGPAWVGLLVNDLTSSFRNQFGIPVFRGAAVTNVTAGSPASVVGIQAGDAIIEANGVPINNARDLRAWISGMNAGDAAELIYYRGSESRTAQFILTSDPSQAPSRGMSRPVTPTPSPAPLPAPDPRVTPTPAPVDSFADRLFGNFGFSTPADPQPNTAMDSNEQTGNSANTSTEPANAPLLELVAPNSPPNKQDLAIDANAQETIASLTRENQQLRKELEEAKSKLEETQTSLNAILKQLQLNLNK